MRSATRSRNRSHTHIKSKQQQKPKLRERGSVRTDHWSLNMQRPMFIWSHTQSIPYGWLNAGNTITAYYNTVTIHWNDLTDCESTVALGTGLLIFACIIHNALQQWQDEHDMWQPSMELLQSSTNKMQFICYQNQNFSESFYFIQKHSHTCWNAIQI